MTRSTRAFAEDLIRAVHRYEASGGSRYRLAAISKVSQAQLSKLVRRVRGSLRLDTAEKLADAMGYRIVLREKSAPR